MTDSEKNIAIAEWCGFKKGVTFESPHCSPSADIARETWINPSGTPVRDIPDFCNDLNAIHEAEEMIEGWSLQYNYCYQLGLIVGSANLGTIHATASQRAEALLKTIGKWKE